MSDESREKAEQKGQRDGTRVPPSGVLLLCGGAAAAFGAVGALQRGDVGGAVVMIVMMIVAFTAYNITVIDA